MLKFGGGGCKLSKVMEGVWAVVENFAASILLLDVKIVDDMSRFAVIVVSVVLHMQGVARLVLCFHVYYGVF